MSAALRNELRASLLRGVAVGGTEARESAPVAVPAALLPECTCIVGDCDRDHDNE